MKMKNSECFLSVWLKELVLEENPLVVVLVKG